VARKSGAIVLVFGENTNDTKAIVTLIQALCPRLAGRVAVRKEPLLLAKGLPVHEVVKKAEKAARALTAEKARGRVDCIFLHEDADDTEPAHEKLCDVKEAALRELGHAVMPLRLHGRLKHGGFCGRTLLHPCAHHGEAQIPTWAARSG
jgi:hypothetical protein